MPRFAFILLVLLAGLAPLSSAQLPLEVPGEEPVELVAIEAPRSVEPGRAFEIVFKVKVQPPHHIYGLERAGVGVPTSFALEGGEGRIEVAGPPQADRAPKTKVTDLPAPDSTPEAPTFVTYDYFEGAVSFRLPVRAAAEARPGAVYLEGIVNYQACTDTSCLPPAQARRPVELVIEKSMLRKDGPVSARVIPPTAPLKRGQTFEAVVEVVVEPPYHIYGLVPVDVELPTSFSPAAGETTIAAAGPVKAGRPPRQHREGEVPYDYYEGPIRFTVPLKIAQGAPSGAVEARLAMDFMACDDDHCLPPATLNLPIALTVATAKPAAPVEEPAAPVEEPGLPEPMEEPLEAEPRRAHFRLLKPEGGIWRAPPGGTFEVLVEATMDEGWHIYGLERLDVEYPTGFDLEETEVLELAGPVRPSRNPKRKQDEVTRYDYWEGTVRFTVPVRVKAGTSPGERNAQLSVDFMSCTMERCLNPTFAELPFTFEVAAGAANAAAAEDGDRAAEVRPEKERVAPGARLRVDVPLKNALPGLTPGALLAEEAVTLYSSADFVLADPGRIVDKGGERVARFEVEVKKGIDDGERDFRGALSHAGGRLEFAGRIEIRSTLWGFIFLAAISALIALATPCVYPMIPVTIAFFTKQGEAKKASAVASALMYCLGIILSFVVIGVAFTLALGGSGAVDFATHWLTNLLIGVLFIFFALSLFGVFTLQLPPFLMRLLGSAQGKAQGGGVMGILLLGFLFSLTTFTCTAPFVGSLLAGAASSGGYLRPVIGMGVFATVLAIPFFFLSLFPARLQSLPRSGSWLNKVKVCMGFVELIAAFKFIGGMDMALGLDFFTRALVLSVWIATFAVMALYLLGVFRLPHDGPAGPTSVTGMLFALGSLIFAVWLSTGLGGAALEVDAFLPREKLERTEEGRQAALIEALASIGARVPGEGASAHATDLGKSERFENDYTAALAAAKKADAPLFVEFTGHSCVNCVRVERLVMPSLLADFRPFVFTKLYVDHQDPPSVGTTNTKLQQRLVNRVSQPYYVVIDPHSESVLRAWQYAEGKTVDGFRSELKQALDVFRDLQESRRGG